MSKTTSNATIDATIDATIGATITTKVFSLWKKFYCNGICITIFGLGLVGGIGYLYCTLFPDACSSNNVLGYFIVGLALSFFFSLILVVIGSWLFWYLHWFYFNFTFAVYVHLFFGIPLLFYELTDLCLYTNSCYEICEGDDSSVLRSCSISRHFFGYIGFGFLLWLFIFLIVGHIGICICSIDNWWHKRHTPSPNSILPVSRTTPTTYTPPVPAKPKNSFIQTEAECAICINVMESKDLTTLRCGHKFHKDCINDWLQRGGGCPYCRKNVSLS